MERDAGRYGEQIRLGCTGHQLFPLWGDSTAEGPDVFKMHPANTHGFIIVKLMEKYVNNIYASNSII